MMSLVYEEHDSDGSIDKLTDSADEPVASISNKESGPSKYKFNKHGPFIPPPDLEFVETDLEPEPTDGTPYTYFKRFVTNDMFEYLAEETNKYAHQKNRSYFTNL